MSPVIMRTAALSGSRLAVGTVGPTERVKNPCRGCRGELRRDPDPSPHSSATSAGHPRTTVSVSGRHSPSLRTIHSWEIPCLNPTYRMIAVSLSMASMQPLRSGALSLCDPHSEEEASGRSQGLTASGGNHAANDAERPEPWRHQGNEQHVDRHDAEGSVRRDVVDLAVPELPDPKTQRNRSIWTS